MWTRRQFLSRTSLAMLGATGSAFALPTDANVQEGPPDGSASRGMITLQADEAISRGLAYLARSQWGDGAFGTKNYRGNTAVTSLGGLAFMAGGHLPGRGKYGSVVAKALARILDLAKNSQPPGFLHNRAGTVYGPMYGHGFATLFLAEAYGMVQDPDLRDRLHDTLQKAVALILKSQNSEGGWRYKPYDPEADISVTICQIMALRAARNAGFYVPKAQVDKCVKYVRACQYDGGAFRYQLGFNGGPPDPFARTAAGVCALYSAGIYQGKEIDSGLRYLQDHKPQAAVFGNLRDMHYFYGHYYAAQAMWTAGGDYWAEWFPYIRDELLSHVHTDGNWSDPNCNHYATAMACIILQIPNNYLPIFQK